MDERRSSLRPALAVSAGLHLAVLLALLISWKLAPPLTKPLQVVAVSIVSNAPVANVRAAQKAPERQTASAPEPAPPTPEPPAPVEAPVPPTPAPPPPPAPRHHPHPTPRPLPEPEPAPPPPRPVHHTPPPKPVPTPRREPRPEPKPKPESKPRPEPKPTPPKPKPPKPTPPKPDAKPQPDLDLDSLSKSAAKSSTRKALNLDALSKARAREQSLDLTALSDSPGKGHAQKHADLDLTALAAGGHRASTRGPARAETDRSAHPAVGAATALDASSLGALQAKLYRYWHPNCGVEGATGVIVRVRIRLNASNDLVGTPTLLSQSSSGADDSVVEASAQRARTAVAQAAPFDELPKNAPKDIVLKFNAKEACGG